MLPFRTTFCDSSLIRVSSDENCRRKLETLPVFDKKHLISLLKPASKTRARKLVRHIFIESIDKVPKRRSNTRIAQIRQEGDRLYVTTRINTGFSPGDRAKDYIRSLGTQLPQHLLGAIDITNRILQWSKPWYILMKLDKYCEAIVPQPNTTMKDLLASHIEPNRVFLFLRAVLKKLLPRKVWGTQGNSSLFYQTLSKMLNSRKLDKKDWISVFECIDISAISWLKGKSRKENMRCFFIWLFNDFLYVILRRFFYITESANQKNRMFYYRKETWEKILHRVVEKQVTSKAWTKISSEGLVKNTRCLYLSECSDAQHFSFFNIRLLPKSKSLRVIMLKKAIAVDRPIFGSQNVIPDKILLILLTALWDAHPFIRGSSGFSIRFVYRRWKKFVLSHASKKHRTHAFKKPIYFVKIDVMNCFDTIPHAKLLCVLRRILAKCHHRKIPLPPKHSNLHYSTKEVWKSLKISLQNILQVGGEFYLKSVGIPQGWRLACILCNLFYGDLERKEFPHLLSGVHGAFHRRLLLRVIDDFYLATTDKDEAIEFVRKMHDGYPEYGLRVNFSKTVTNFPIPIWAGVANKDRINVLDRDEPFPWFGHLFLPRANASKNSPFMGHGAAIELKRYKTLVNIRDAMSAKHCRPSKCTEECACVKTIIRNISSRMSVLCCDRTINSFGRLMRNVFEVSILAALQWLAGFYYNGRTVTQDLCVLIFKNIVTKGIMTKFTSRHDTLDELYKNTILWVGLKGLNKVLRRHHSDFKDTLKLLKAELSQQNAALKSIGVWQRKKHLLRKITASYPAELKSLKVS